MELLDRAKAAYIGPFGPVDTRNAVHLVGEEILFAMQKEGLGSYGTLESIEHGRKNPYRVKMIRDSESNGCPVISYLQTNWIVKNEKYL